MMDEQWPPRDGPAGEVADPRRRDPRGMMDEQRLIEIEARANAATPGPWETDHSYHWCIVSDGHSWQSDRSTPVGQCVECPNTQALRESPDDRGRTWHLHRDRWSADDEHNVFGPDGPGFGGAIAALGSRDYDDRYVSMTPEDAAFIACAREAIPALIAQVRRLQNELSYLKGCQL